MSLPDFIANKFPAIGIGLSRIEYQKGNTEKAEKMISIAYRSMSVKAGGKAGSVGGPLVSGLGAVYGGYLADFGELLKTGKPQGYMSDIENIGNDLLCGRDPRESIRRATSRVISDAVSGCGSSLT